MSFDQQLCAMTRWKYLIANNSPKRKGVLQSTIILSCLVFLLISSSVFSGSISTPVYDNNIILGVGLTSAAASSSEEKTASSPENENSDGTSEASADDEVERSDCIVSGPGECYTDPEFSYEKLMVKHCNIHGEMVTGSNQPAYEFTICSSLPSVSDKQCNYSSPPSKTPGYRCFWAKFREDSN